MQPQLIAGRYRVLRAIGRGAMGTVWLCRDEVLSREVAVKQIGVLPGESATETKRAEPAAEPVPGDQGSKRRWISLGLVALLVVGAGGAYLVSQNRDQGSVMKTFSCRAGGYVGYIRLSDTSTPVVSYKIVTGSNSGGNSANVSVSDGGMAPSRTFQNLEGVQDGAFHAMQGPYSRSGGAISFTFVFDKSNRQDPTCSGGGYLDAG